MPTILTIYIFALTTLLGLAMGSFANCLAWRMVHHEDVVHGRSHCALCNHPLSARELVPVLSWLAQKGRCRHCGGSISIRYPVTEVICAAAFAGLVFRYGLSLATLQWMALSVILFAASLVDLDEGIIPDRLVLAALFNYLFFTLPKGMEGFQLAGWGIVNSLAIFLPLLILVLAMDKVLGRESMGGGDLKLYFAIGLYFNWKSNLFLLIASCLFGILFYCLSRVRIRDGSQRIVFGPSIAAAAYLSMVAADPVVHWYLNLFH